MSERPRFEQAELSGDTILAFITAADEGNFRVPNESLLELAVMQPPAANLIVLRKMDLFHFLPLADDPGERRGLLCSERAGQYLNPGLGQQSTANRRSSSRCNGALELGRGMIIWPLTPQAL